MEEDGSLALVATAILLAAGITIAVVSNKKSTEVTTNKRRTTFPGFNHGNPGSHCG